MLSIQKGAQTFSEAPTTIRVLTFNILHGATTEGTFDLDVIANVIRNANPDLVALQEVDFKTQRAHNYDLVTELGYRTKLSPLFGRAMYYDGGEYGEGLLSKYSFVSTRNMPLPFSTGNEPRTALEGVVVLPSGDTIVIVGTHLDHLENETDRISQALKINEYWKGSPYPTILAGDLNDVPGSNTINIFEALWSATYNKNSPEPTYPSTKPIKKIDYVMTYPEARWKLIRSEVICDTIASDHCGYLVELELLSIDN